MQIPLNQILITDRQRLEFDEHHVLNLMQSFADIGQVQSVLVSEHFATIPEEHAARCLEVEWPREYRVIAGATRCEAARRLGWTHIRADLADDTQSTTINRQKAELVENLLRKDLPWQDTCLAISRLYRDISNDKSAAGEKWTEEMMGVFTGYSKVAINYMLRVAAALAINPRDEEIWNAGGFRPAFQVVLARVDAECVKELDRRKQEIATAMLPSITLVESEIGDGQDNLVTSTLSPAAAPVQQVRIYGNVIPKPGTFSLAILNKLSNSIAADLVNIAIALKPGGYLILVDIPHTEWQDWKDWFLSFDSETFQLMPYPFIWDKQILSPTIAWPFVPNQAFCMVLEKRGARTELKLENSGSVQSFPDNDPRKIPLAVVSALTTACCPTPGEPVLNPDCSAIIPLLELGHVPVWQESDEEKYKATWNMIKEWYEKNMPNCEVVS